MRDAVDPDGIEWLLSLGIFLVGVSLSALTGLVWRRERDRKLLLVAVAYALFALRGLAVIVEPVVERSPEVRERHPSLPVVAAGFDFAPPSGIVSRPPLGTPSARRNGRSQGSFRRFLYP